MSCVTHVRGIPWVEYRRQWRTARAAAGICIECRSIAEPGRLRCAKHGEKNRQRYWRRVYSSSLG